MAQEKPKQSLGDFVDANQKLLAVLGVMIALSVYAQGLKDQFFGSFLSFMFLSCAVLVFIEVFLKFEKEKAWRLEWFQHFSFLALVVLFLVWLMNLRMTMGQQGVQTLIMLLSLAALGAILRLSRLTKWLSQFAFLRRRGIREAINFLLFVALVLAASAIATKTSHRIARALHEMAADTTTFVPK